MTDETGGGRRITNMFISDVPTTRVLSLPFLLIMKEKKEEEDFSPSLSSKFLRFSF